MNAAIAKYIESSQVLPSEHRTLWKLALAYERRRDWPHAAETLTRAVELAPAFAIYSYRLGQVLVNEAEESSDSALYERAKAPLEQCIARDPNIAACHDLLREAAAWTNAEQKALREYSRAISLDPKTGYFYPPLAELYMNLAMPTQADAVLSEAIRQLESNERNRSASRSRSSTP